MFIRCYKFLFTTTSPPPLLTAALSVLPLRSHVTFTHGLVPVPVPWIRIRGYPRCPVLRLLIYARASFVDSFGFRFACRYLFRYVPTHTRAHVPAHLHHVRLHRVTCPRSGHVPFLPVPARAAALHYHGYTPTCYHYTHLLIAGCLPPYYHWLPALRYTAPSRFIRLFHVRAGFSLGPRLWLDYGWTYVL